MRTVFTSLGTTKIPRINKEQKLCKFFPNCNTHVCIAWGTGHYQEKKIILSCHYLSPGRAEDFGGITWFLEEQKGGSVVTENPKGVINVNFGRIPRGDHSNLFGKWRHGRGGSRKSSNVIRGDHFSEVTFKGGSAKFHFVKPQFPPPGR